MAQLSNFNLAQSSKESKIFQRTVRRDDGPAQVNLLLHKFHRADSALRSQTAGGCRLGYVHDAFLKPSPAQGRCDRALSLAGSRLLVEAPSDEIHPAQ